MESLPSIQQTLNTLADPKRAKASAWFFKTGPGQYGEGDHFLGIAVPALRKVARAYRDLTLPAIADLLANSIHEYRFVALEILVMQYENGDERIKKQITSFYLRQKKWVNNWDLVDTSAPYILGDQLLKHPKSNTALLTKLAKSKTIWDRRIAIVSTFMLIREGAFAEPIRIATMLLHDKHDLIQKATGWMLREVGKRSEQTLLKFLNKHHTVMPRTMLRYAIERLPKNKRLHYLYASKKGILGNRRYT